MNQTEKQNLPRTLGWQGWLATGLGVGLIPFAPGTFGSLWGIPLSLGIGLLPGLPLQVAVILILIVAGVPVCTVAARRLGKKDPGAIVLDEIVSFPIVYFALPISGLAWENVRVLLLGFVLHRIFDIAKLPPVKQLERLPEGRGIVADDVAAALYAHFVLRGILYFIS